MLYERIATTTGMVPSVLEHPFPAATASPPPSGPAPVRRPGRVLSDQAAGVRVQVLDLIAPWAVAGAALAARLATAASGPTDWDSAQYAAAVARFDVNHGRPQPPGYWLFVAAGRLVHGTGLATVESLVLVSALASALAAGLVVVAGRDLGGRWVGLCAGVLVATSPFAWFSGSIVATYSFDLAVAPLLIILAWRARPHSWHGAAAFVALGLAAGFRQSTVPMFGLLALVAAAGSIRRIREAVAAAAAGAVAVAVWFVPMILAQPGGASWWARATSAEGRGAIRSTSVFAHTGGWAGNLGTFAAYTTVALAPLVVLALAAAVGLGARALLRSVRGIGVPTDVMSTTAPPTGAVARTGAVSTADPPRRGPAHRRRRAHWTRPWYQSRTVVLVAATVPAMAVTGLIEFAKGGYLLAYLPGAVIALLLVPAALLRSPTTPASRAGATPSSGSSGSSAAIGSRTGRPAGALAWGLVATVAVGAIAVVGADRFLTGTGVLPVSTDLGQHGLWLTQARYQAPYADTRAAIRSADAMASGLARLGPMVDPGRDVIVIDSLDGGAAFYRSAGWALPSHRVTLIVPGAAIYNEQGGSLFYTSQATVPVGPGGSIYLIASPSLPGLSELAGTGKVTLMRSAPHIGDYLVWRIAPGASVLGVRVTVVVGTRPLGAGLVG